MWGCGCLGLEVNTPYLPVWVGVGVPTHPPHWFGFCVGVGVGVLVWGLGWVCTVHRVLTTFFFLVAAHPSIDPDSPRKTNTPGGAAHGHALGALRRDQGRHPFTNACLSASLHIQHPLNACIHACPHACSAPLYKCMHPCLPACIHAYSAPLYECMPVSMHIQHPFTNACLPARMCAHLYMPVCVCAVLPGGGGACLLLPRPTQAEAPAAHLPSADRLPSGRRC